MDVALSIELDKFPAVMEKFREPRAFLFDRWQREKGSGSKFGIYDVCNIYRHKTPDFPSWKFSKPFNHALATSFPFCSEIRAGCFGHSDGNSRLVFQ